MVRDGRSFTAEYKTWRSMQSRCDYAKERYRSHNGRGISFFSGWRGPEGFEKFLMHVGPRPSSEHSIDRIDNDGNYEPGNVRWATRAEQARNRRPTRWIDSGGSRASRKDWADSAGVSPTTISRRLRAGWSVEKAVSAPAPIAASIQRGRPKAPRLITHSGRTLRLAEWARELGIDRDVLRWRLKQGWDVQRALTTEPARNGRP